MREHQRLLLVVGDVEEGGADLALDPGQLDPQLRPELGVERREGLVQQQDAGAAGERPGDGHPLLLPAGELVRPTAPVAGELDEVQVVADPGAQLRAAQSQPAQPVGHVVPDREVGEERVGLEDGVDVPPVGGYPHHVAAPQQDRSPVGVLEPGDHPQQRRLPAPGRAEHGEELALPHPQAQVTDGDLVGVGPGHPAQLDGGRARGVGDAVVECRCLSRVLGHGSPPGGRLGWMGLTRAAPRRTA